MTCRWNFKDVDYLPRHPNQSSTLPEQRTKNQDLNNLSRLVARSWLHLLYAILSGLNRHFSDRAELIKLFDGLNRILLVHGADDTNIVVLALKVCMLASSRFRRLFASGQNFGIFIPAIFKTFCDTTSTSTRTAIQRAWQAFYAAHGHEEAFIFQALSAIFAYCHSPASGSSPSSLLRH